MMCTDKGPRRRLAWLGWVAAAACLLGLAGFLIWETRPQEPEVITEHQWSGPMEVVQQRSESMAAKDYFKNIPTLTDVYWPAEDDPVMPPYAASMTLYDRKREAMEAASVLPIMPEFPSQDFRISYNGDGSLYKAEFRWIRYADSDITLTAAPQELHEAGRTDTELPVTVTERDGVPITAWGYMLEYTDSFMTDGWLTLTWQTPRCWYQLSSGWWGGGTKRMEELVALLDWFWAHPLDLEQFASPPAATIQEADPAAYPDAFRDAIPDFAALGYDAESERLTVSHGIPVWSEGVYTRGDTRVRWTVDTAADADDWAACPGSPQELTRETLDAALAERDYVNLFVDAGDRPLMATLRLESGTAEDAWALIQSLCSG